MISRRLFLGAGAASFLLKKAQRPIEVLPLRPAKNPYGEWWTEELAPAPQFDQSEYYHYVQIFRKTMTVTNTARKLLGSGEYNRILLGLTPNSLDHFHLWWPL